MAVIKPNYFSINHKNYQKKLSINGYKEIKLFIKKLSVSCGIIEHFISVRQTAKHTHVCLPSL